jgi:hypothetical protein
VSTQQLQALVADPVESIPSMSAPEVITVWACLQCAWIWPELRRFCGICGKNRSGCTAFPASLRMLVSFQAAVEAHLCG